MAENREAATPSPRQCERSDLQLIQRAVALYDSIFVSDCFGAHDVREYDALLTELEKRGYLAGNSVSFVKQSPCNEEA